MTDENRGPRRDGARDEPRRGGFDRDAGTRGRDASGRGPRGADRPDRGRDDRRDGSTAGRRDDRGSRGASSDDRRDTGRPTRGGAERDREQRGGPRLAPKTPRRPEPRIPDGVTGNELDRSVHQQLRTLSKENAEGVAQHLVMVAALLEADEIENAMAHAETAVRRAGRVPAAREALGMVAYRSGDFARALSEFRTVRRISGSDHLLPLMVDCERGLGRHERALDLAQSPEAKRLPKEERVELAIVIGGIRRDLGQTDAALVALQIPELKKGNQPRLKYAYADTLLGLGRVDEARDWFEKAADADVEFETDAVERLEELDGVSTTDLLGGADEEDEGDE
ncbi:tetratricopeptide repeat protein [Knoellia sp. CPCC 206453]|uniref:tetratricopeptide repeat protein n=1 Tax=Knoellia pratensis TaxID=3404796 RepID=UPI0036195CC4